jgi:hypothetical protein
MTRALTTAIFNWARNIEREIGAPWHAHPGAHEVFRLAIGMWLSRIKPEGPPVLGERPPHRWIASDDPATIASTLEYTEFQLFGRQLQEEAVREERGSKGDKSKDTGGESGQ